MSKINFLKTAVTDYKVGALTPSSQFVVKRILRLLPPGAKYIVEYGAGDGVITRMLLERIPEDGKVVAIEMNSDFIPVLKRIRDPRLIILQDDVVNVLRDSSRLPISQIDAVVSGIPFSFMNESQRWEIVRETFAHLSSRARFIVYQVSPLMLTYLKRFFGERVRVGIELRNFPPYFILTAEK